MKTEHLSPQDQKALFIARLFTLTLVLLLMTTLLAVVVYLRQINDQDKRTEYIESGHSEIK